MTRGIALAALLAAAAHSHAFAQSSESRNGEWRYYHYDLAGTRYAPLDRVDSTNVNRLAIAWEWRSDSVTTGREFKNESTPIMVDGVLYFTTGADRAVVAADAGTGATKWVWRMDEGARARVAPRRNSGRGVSWWSDADDARVFVVTPGFHLVALDAATGTPVASFGQNGIVDLKLQLGVELDPETAAIGNSSPPLVFEDIVVVGPALEVGLRPRSRANVPGRVLALDARTGELLWRFHTIPQQGEFGIDTWEGESWRYTGNAGAWAPLSLDQRRGWLYLPLEAATGDYYGGHRLGDNLFSTSLVCVDIRTGQRIWHRQIVHHDIWDYDNPATPILADIDVNGRRIEAVVQITKQSFAYVFDRVTGEPVWPMTETPVPPSDVPGERAALTQPMPSRPLPFDRQGVTIDDLIDFTPALRAQAIELVRPYRLGALFAPASLRDAPDGTQGTLSLPGTLGGANWEHAAFDPESGTLFVGSWTTPAVLALAHDTTRPDVDYVMIGGRAPDVQGLPLIKPPYSRITAIDLNTGEHRWLIPNGDTPEIYRSHETLAGLDIPPTGSHARPLLLATPSLLFAGEGWGGAPMLRAIDKATGRTVSTWTLPGQVTSQPMTYLHGGRQYIAFWVGDVRSDVRARLLAFALR
ncbi:MAG: PQQ-binding-like beta-propeller repeat protein [Longimicrobiales bacterium]